MTVCVVSNAASPVDLPRVSAAVVSASVVLRHSRMHRPECVDPTVVVGAPQTHVPTDAAFAAQSYVKTS